MHSNNHNCLIQAQNLIEQEAYQEAISILQELEKKLTSQDLPMHEKLMLKVLEKYKRLKTLEQKDKDSLELGLLYLSFDKQEAAQVLFAEKYQLNPSKFLAEIKQLSHELQKNIFNILGHFNYLYNAEQALYWFNKELEVEPSSVNAFLAISELNFMRGEIKLAINNAKNAIASFQKDSTNLTILASIVDNLIMMMHYDPDCSLEDIYKISINYVECLPPSNNTCHFDNFKHLELSSKKDKLRVGFISGDLRKHALYYWLKNFLKDTNFQSIEIFLYHNQVEDSCSEYYKSQAQNWRNIYTMVDEAVYSLIQEDKIDVLIDLSGHTKDNRLSLFKLKPSPVQVTWLGQAGPLGVPEIDFMFTDAYQVEPEEEKFYTERVKRFKGFIAPYSYEEKAAHKSIQQEIPFYRNGFISFGSANGLIKTNTKVLETWSLILKEVPNSKLFLKNRSLDDPSTKDKIHDFFLSQNITKERIILSGLEERDDYLNFYNQLDLALDPFPIGGGTTSLDTLSMGVPIMTLKGKHFAHRCTFSINKNLGLEHLISENHSEYINKTILLAKAPHLIQESRNYILKNFKSSKICNMSEFVQEFENNIREIWEETIQ